MDKYSEYRFDNIIQDPDRSFFHKYQDLVIGNRRIGFLFYFEVCTVLFNPIQGMLGLALRKLLFPPLFGRVGRRVVFGHHISIRSPGNIQIGDNTVIDDFTTLSFRGSTGQHIQLGDNVLIGRLTMLKTRGGSIEIADHVHVGPNCHLGSASTLLIGEYSLIGSNCSIGGLHHGYEDADKPIMQQALDNRGGVTIGKDVWLGAGVTVLDGVSIGDSAIIGASSVITRDIPAYSIAVGSPAKITKQRSRPSDDAASTKTVD